MQKEDNDHEDAEPEPESKVVVTEQSLREQRRLSKIKKWLLDDDSDYLAREVRKLVLICPICCDIMQSATSTHCGHVFCEACLLAALNTVSQCPLCQNPMTVLQTHKVYL